jgi:hypothetical protein
MRTLGFIALCTLALAGPALAGPPVIDGSAADTLYTTTPLATQDTQTGFGNSNLGRPDIANGSELDGAYGVVYNGVLYLVLTGNFETNGNKVEIFFDTRAGGQNRLLASNPGTPNVGLLRMSDDGSGNGLTFQTGFEADFWVSFNCFGLPTSIYVDYAELYVNAGNPGVLYYCGAGQTKCETTGGQLTGGEPGAPAILVTVDNSNVAGVDGGFGVSDGSGVLTGAELAIPLAAIGNPAGSFTITAFVNGQQHDFVSNQILGGLSGLEGNNLGEPRNVNFQTVAFGVQQPFAVGAAPTPTGACCKTGLCTIKTQAQCTSTGGVYQGDNSNCDGNPCNATAQGRCCIDDGYSGQCKILEQTACTQQGGTWGGAGTTCEGCPCLLAPKGACCVQGGCQLKTQTECTTLGGVYAGDFTQCTTPDGPCDQGACCVGVDCVENRRFECTALAGRFLGTGTTCAVGVCDFTITTPYVAGDFNGWNAGDPAYAMTETPPGSHKYVKAVTGLTPGSRHEFKITKGDWSVNLPSSGNSWFFADGAGAITITYDGNYYGDGWKPAKDRLNLNLAPETWTAVGNFQSEVGGSDWNNADPVTAMTSQGGGLYSFTATNIPAGDYLGKAVKTGSWDALGNDNRSVNADNINFTVAAATDTLTIEVDALVGRIKLTVEAAVQICRGDFNCDGVIDFDDINAFVFALNDFPGWQATYGSQSPLGCSDENADMNDDGVTDFDDINPFVEAVSLGQTCPNP